MVALRGGRGVSYLLRSRSNLVLHAAGEFQSSPRGQHFFYFGSRDAEFRRIFSEFGLILTTAT